jgi:hypothetical protein
LEASHHANAVGGDEVKYDSGASGGLYDDMMWEHVAAAASEAADSKNTVETMAYCKDDGGDVFIQAAGGNVVPVHGEYAGECKKLFEDKDYGEEKDLHESTSGDTRVIRSESKGDEKESDESVPGDVAVNLSESKADYAEDKCDDKHVDTDEYNTDDVKADEKVESRSEDKHCDFDCSVNDFEGSKAHFVVDYKNEGNDHEDHDDDTAVAPSKAEFIHQASFARNDGTTSDASGSRRGSTSHSTKAGDDDKDVAYENVSLSHKGGDRYGQLEVQQSASLIIKQAIAAQAVESILHAAIEAQTSARGTSSAR